MNTPQFDLGTMLSAPQTAIQQIPCDQLHPYHNHKFELYSGERLEDMVASIKENGVLSPIIVQPDGDGYEIRKFRFSRESRIVLSLTPIIPNRPEKVNLCTLFHTLFIALYRHSCYNQDIEQIGGECNG